MKYTRNLVLASLFFSSSIFGAMSGKVNGNYYTSPGNQFSMEIPNKNRIKHHISDKIVENDVSVLFTNDYGNNVKIETLYTTEDIGAILRNHPDKNLFENEMEILASEIIKSYEKMSPKVLKKEFFIDEKFDEAIFFVLKMKGGSGLKTIEDGVECDSTIGHLISYNKTHMIILSIQFSPVGDRINDIIRKHSKDGKTTDPVKELKTQLIQVRRSMVF